MTAACAAAMDGRKGQGYCLMPLERRVPLLHRTGLHLRAASRFAETGATYQSQIGLSVAGRCVDGKSVLEILTLGAIPGVDLVISAEGVDAEQALDALEELVRNNFDEEA